MANPCSAKSHEHQRITAWYAGPSNYEIAGAAFDNRIRSAPYTFGIGAAVYSTHSLSEPLPITVGLERSERLGLHRPDTWVLL
jgi:hypothetical protein